MNKPADDPQDESAGSIPAPSAPRLVLRSEDLLQGRSEVWIQHGAEVYRLRLTAAGKLYLTK